MRHHGWLAFVAIGMLAAAANVATGQSIGPYSTRGDMRETLRDLAPATLPDPSPPAIQPAGAAANDEPANGELLAAAYRNDATINDIAFADAQNGWAVGDAGVIWHTSDGGRQWQRQASGLTCRLQSVQFIDAKTGWAAGGRTAPYTHQTSGVVLRTRDGGEHWTAIDKLMLPALRRIQFFSPARGCAIAAATAMYPCGLFFTDDGGRQWSPLPIGDKADCVAGSFAAVGQGAIALADGGLAVVHDGRIRAANCLPVGLAAVGQMQFSGPRAGWLVGDGELVQSTIDGGQTWQPCRWRNSLTSGTLTHTFDFSAVAVRGSQIWIAGSPGDRVLHSLDGGRTWLAAETQQSAPISAITFVDDLHGWCAGALGTIEASDDGGRTWRRQRAGGERVALLGIFSEPSDVPLELFARESAADGYLCAVEVMNRRDVETHWPSEASLQDRMQESLAALGVARAKIAWQFPLRQPGIDLPQPATTAVWDQVADGDGLAALDAYLVRQIRMWRPSVVVTSDHNDAARSGERLLQRAIVQAIHRAADPAFDKRTPPWNVARIFAGLSPGLVGSVNIGCGQLSPRLGQSLAELTWQPRGVIFDRFSSAPASIGFVPLETAAGGEAGQGDFFSGLGLRPGSEARRELPQPTLEAVAALRRSAQQRRNAEGILKRTAETLPSGWISQVGDLTAAMDPMSAGATLFQLAENHAAAGRWEPATQLFELLVNQYPRHPLALPAERWLLQSYASSVAEHQGPPQSGTDAAAIANERTARPKSRPERAIEMARQIEQFSPFLDADPSVRFPLAAAYRRLGMPREAERALASIRSGPHDDWWNCAEAENWLADPRGAAPKSVWHCAIVDVRPRLDGTLDDPMWQRAEPVELRSALADDGQRSASARLACDAQFLYLAVKCQKVEGVSYDRDKSPRPRQADLSAHDRIDLLLSPDRDSTSYYRLSIDHRGWVSSGCWNGAPWQPVCYVAAGADDRSWTVEAAIPWDQLVAHSPLGAGVRHEPWGVNLQRTIPGVGFQSWSKPAAARIRAEGMGILTFEPGANTVAKKGSVSPQR